MTIPVWPADLPCPIRGSINLALGDNRRMTSADQGPPQVRRSYSRTADMVSMTMVCTRDQRAVFEKFRAEMTAYEALPFAMPDSTTRNWHLLADIDGGEDDELLTEDDVPLLLDEWMLCLFGQGRPTITAFSASRFNVSFEVLVMPI